MDSHNKLWGMLLNVCAHSIHVCILCVQYVSMSEVPAFVQPFEVNQPFISQLLLQFLIMFFLFWCFYSLLSLIFSPFLSVFYLLNLWFVYCTHQISITSFSSSPQYDKYWCWSLLRGSIHMLMCVDAQCACEIT